MESLYDIWSKRNPQWEKRYQESIMDVFTDYGRGTTSYQHARAKIFGAGYEVYILAFFIGLYSDKRLPLSDDSDDLKVLGQPLEKWGNGASKTRKAYPEIRRYLLYALVAKTDIDWIKIDKGEEDVNKAVTKLVNTMEEYANYGFSFLADKMQQEGYFFSPRAFLDIFLQLTEEKEKTEEQDDDGESDVEQL